MQKRRTQRKQGKKRNQDAKKNTIVCKIYANWCGHCKELKPVWAELKNVMSANKNITMMEIEESEMKEKMGELKNICKKDIDVKGFPTIVKICNKKVEYYQGERSVEGLRAWIMPKPTAKTIHGGKKNTRKKNTRRRK